MRKLESAGIDIERRLRVDRKTVWRWRNATSKPDGECAFALWELARALPAETSRAN